MYTNIFRAFLHLRSSVRPQTTMKSNTMQNAVSAISPVSCSAFRPYQVFPRLFARIPALLTYQKPGTKRRLKLTKRRNAVSGTKSKMIQNDDLQAKRLLSPVIKCQIHFIRK